MRFVLFVLCATLSVLFLAGAASADVAFNQSAVADVPCTPGSPCGNIVVAEGAGLFLGDAVFTVTLDGPGRDFQLDRFGFDSDLTLQLVCFAFGDTCTKGKLGSALLSTDKAFGSFGKFDYSLTTGLNGGQDCCQNTFTFVVAQKNGSAMSREDIDDVFAAHAANKSTSGYIKANMAVATPEPSTLLLVGTALTGIASAWRRAKKQ